MQRSQLANDSQPNAGTLGRRALLAAKSHVGAPDPSSVRKRNAGPLILDHEAHTRVDSVDEEPNGLPRRTEFERIVQQVEHDLSDGTAVDVRYHRFTHVRHDVCSALGRQGRERGRD